MQNYKQYIVIAVCILIVALLLGILVMQTPVLQKIASFEFMKGQATEDCENGVDDDGDSFVDCGDFDCVTDPVCGFGSSSSSSPSAEDCENGVDDDGDSFVDCGDFDCVTDPVCGFGSSSSSSPSAEDCENGVDDDGDSYTDCGDMDCVSDPVCGFSSSSSSM